jgi:hypothetical protein
MTTTEERIAWLEQKLRITTGELVQANDRIEVLEAALRAIERWDSNEANPASYGGLPERIRKIVYAALAPEQDK